MAVVRPILTSCSIKQVVTSSSWLWMLVPFIILFLILPGISHLRTLHHPWTFRIHIFISRISLYPTLPKQMPDGSYRMIEYHSRPRPSHDHSYLFLHLRSVAVYGALLAGRLMLPVTASVQSAVGIVQQFPALRTQFGMAFMFPAIQTNHLLDHRFFLLFATVIHC